MSIYSSALDLGVNTIELKKGYNLNTHSGDIIHWSMNVGTGDSLRFIAHDSAINVTYINQMFYHTPQKPTFAGQFTIQ